MQRLIRALLTLETAVAGLATAGVVLCVIWGVFTRYITAQPAVWTAELSGILFTWIVFLGATAAFHEDQHIRVGLLVDILPIRARRVIRLLVDLLMIAFLIYAAWLSYVMMLKGATRPSPILRIPFSLVYLAPLLAFGLMAFNALLRLFGLVPAINNPDAGAEGAL